MVGRQNTKFQPVDLNSGFAAEDPIYADWSPPADQVPVSGNGKDSRFMEDAMWATKPMRTKRANLSAYATNCKQSNSRDATKPKPRLDGTGNWGDFGVKDPATTPPAEDKSNKNGDAYIDSSPVPCTIEGMNEVLKQRVLAARAKSAAAYANGSPSAGAKNVQAASRATSTASSNTVNASSPYHKLIPPHKRKALAGQTTPVPSSPTQLIGVPQPQIPFQATPAKDPPATEDIEDVFALIQKRLDEQQKQKQRATVSGTPATTDVTNSSQRRASSTTLVTSDADTDDEVLARRLQAEEFGLQHVGNAQEMIDQQLNHFKFAQDKTSIPAVGVKNDDMYQKLHKIQEIIWKQKTMQLHEFAESKESLYQMGNVEFQRHYDKVVSAHLAQWDARRDLIEQVVKMQSNLAVENPYLVDELMEMDASGFRAIVDKIFSAHNHNTSVLDVSLQSDRQFIVTEDNLNNVEEAGEQEFDSDGFGTSGGDDDDDDDDDDVIFFKGHGRG